MSQFGMEVGEDGKTGYDRPDDQRDLCHEEVQRILKQDRAETRMDAGKTWEELLISEELDKAWHPPTQQWLLNGCRDTRCVTGSNTTKV